MAGWPGPGQRRLGAMSKESQPTHPASTSGPFTVAELAERLGGEVEEALEGEGEREITGVRTLEDAGPEHLSFLTNRKYVRQLESTDAGAVLLDRNTDAHGRTVIRLDDPYSAFARALQLFHPQPWPEPGIDPRAHVHPDATVDETATVEAFAFVGAGAEVGAESWIESGAYVGRGVTLGERCRLMPGSVAYEGSVLGHRVWLNPGVVVGGEGFGFAPNPAGHVKIPQVARAIVEDDVEIGANSCVDRGALGDTVVRRHAKLDNMVQIGHGSEVGEGSLLAAYAALAGSAKIGKGVMLAGKAGVINHLEVGDGSTFASQSIAMSDHPPGSHLAGTPAMDRRRWMKASAVFQDLPDLLKRIRKLEKLEKRVEELEEELQEKVESTS